ncbi:hypothetical protein SSP35_01_00090 [Streptomyces sp. NBRC 110611]|uniref:hypothetical protein n=1 Tax=Streptomyces sp. NBRC 110611 TaxID=1621259 RepID=UPI00083789D4|nr:hypothetical protein [Streptomyces sp. NBRC 110611]GAU64673.1 hypothetical protein SSP35_01_00090 [Streptomyces sp. NBRC 110611]
MSTGEDGGYGGDGHRGTGTGQTRTRLPESEGDLYGSPRRPRSGLSSRNLVTIVGVIVLLLAAIAFANRSGSGNNESPSAGAPKDADAAAAQPTAPTGTKPVSGKGGGIAAGFPRTKQGAESAAANYAVALVSANILKPKERHAIVQQVFVPAKAGEMQTRLDAAYSTAFLKKLGLDAEGNAAQGMTYISRTVPVGTKLVKLQGDTADLEVWCTGLFGTAGVKSTTPVTTDWFTLRLQLKWADGDWKVAGFSQQDGPAPVNGDDKTSSADQIAKAVEQYGGFTYAR